MQIEKIKNKGQGRLFRNEHAEAMTKTIPLVIYSIYIPLIFFLLYYAITYKHIKGIEAFLFFIGGVISWTLFEYLMHRFLFHFIAESERTQRIIYKLHGVHHEYPRDKERLFMPPIPSLVVASILFYFFYSLMSWNVLMFFPGFITGYLVYGSMHYAIHAFAPPKFLKALWRNHHLHHYKTPDKGFGVSSVLWDVIFRTVPKKEEVSNQ